MKKIRLGHLDPAYDWYAIRLCDMDFDILLLEREGLYWVFPEALVLNRRNIGRFNISEAMPFDAQSAKLLFPESH